MSTPDLRSTEAALGARGHEPPVVCVVLNWNSWEDTVACLTTLRGIEYSNATVIAVDNGSTNDSVARIRQAHPSVEVLSTGSNLGYAGGVNAGIRAALERGAAFVWLLNNDTKPRPDALSALVGKAMQQPHLGAVGSVLMYMSSQATVQAWGGGRVNCWLGRATHATAAKEDEWFHYLTAASLLLHAGLPPVAGAGLLGGIAAALLLAQARWMLPQAPAAGPGFVLPRGRLALLGALCFVSFLAEGAILDWSAVLLRLWREAAPATAALGYAAFSVTMAAGRFGGDRLLRRITPVAMLRLGGCLAALGFLAMAALPWPAATLGGCALVGLGGANIVPVLFGAAGRMPGMAPGPAISAAATPGYLGLLLGPALIGAAASATTLPLALALVALLLAGVAAMSRRAAG